MGNARTYFKDYVDTIKGFNDFHNEVINMPRPDFENMGLQILRVIASYLLLIENSVSSYGNNYKEMMGLISDELKKGHYPLIRDISFENKYFNFLDLDRHYDNEGRMFRHYMGLASFWGMIYSISRQKKKIKFDVCNDFVLIEENKINDFARNLGLNVDIKTNDFIQNLSGIASIKLNANYHPTLAILKYMNEIGRDATDFELSVLLGRIDKVQDEQIIIKRALEIGKKFISRTRLGQQQEFFKMMGWFDKDTEIMFSYASSQQPWFKFQTYFLFLKDFGLVTYNSVTGSYALTEDAKGLLGTLPASVLDLNKLLAKLDLSSGNTSDATMKDILIKTNLDTLKELVSNESLIKEINKYSLQHPNISKDGKKQRNQFIAELARIRENYKCQAGTETFERPDGRNYVEAHHIIEFAKGGPDILENLLALGPTPHTQIHRGSDKARRDMYTHLMSRGAITYKLFKTMIEEYHCLTEDHLEFLVINQLISTQQKSELLTLM